MTPEWIYLIELGLVASFFTTFLVFIFTWFEEEKER